MRSFFLVVATLLLSPSVAHTDIGDPIDASRAPSQPTRAAPPVSAPDAMPTPTPVAPRVSTERDAAHDERPGRADGWHVDLMARTDFPLDAGASLDFEAPSRFRIGLGVGTIPRGYVNAINTVSENAGWYDGETSEFIAESLESSLVVHPNIGLRPFRRSGFVIDGGLKLALLSGQSAQTDALAAATGVQAPAAIALQPTSLSSQSVTGMATVRLGWVAALGENIVFRLDVGGAFTVFANNTIEVPDDVAQPEVWQKLAIASEGYLDGVMTDHVRTATVGVGLGWRSRYR